MARSKVKLTVDQIAQQCAAAGETLKPVEAVLASNKPKRKRAPRKIKSLKERIEGAISASELHDAAIAKSHEMTIRKTGQSCHSMPWQAASPCPWSPGYTRVVIPLKEALRNGARALVQIVRNDHLIHGRVS